MHKHDVDHASTKLSDRSDLLASKVLKKEAGFTLIELLIVIAIIAILMAIAIPQFTKYKQSAYLDSARSDVRNAVVAIEAYHATYGVYPEYFEALGPGPMAVKCEAASTNGTTTGGTCAESTDTDNDISISPGNYITFKSDTTCTNGYTVSAYNENITPGNIGASGKEVSYNSCTGQYTNF